MAKFSKELAEKGWDVYVVYARSKNNNSAWTKDIENDKIKSFPTKSNYPEIFWTQPKGLIQKIKYKLAWRYMEKKCAANFFDRAALWESSLIKKASELIEKHHISNVLATGGPFHTLSHAAKLKKKYPQLNLILDYRDQWVDNQSFMGMTTIGAERLKNEVDLEQEALLQANHVITVADFMTENVRERSTNKSCSFNTILNGFDPDDFPEESHNEPKGDTVRLVFTGTLYDGLSGLLFPFFQKLSQQNVRLDFYGTAAKEYQNFVKENKISNIQFHGKIPLSSVYEKIGNSHYGCLFLNDDHLFSTSTKFFEYLGMKKRILVVSNPGELQNFVEKHRIGYAVVPQDNFQGLEIAIRNANNPFSDFDVNLYSTKNATEKLITLLQ